MNQIDVCIEQLIEAVLNSDEYKKYHELRSKIELEPEKKSAVDELRKQNFILHATKRSSGELYDELEKLKKDATQLRAQPLVEEYLAAELGLCRLIQKINWKLMEKVDFDCAF